MTRIEELKMTKTVETTIEIAPKPRFERRLPQPYYVVVDDWLEKLGEKSYLLWFKLLTKVDRTDGDKMTVKYTQNKLAKSLGMSKPTLVKLLKPLYEYGFIVYKEWQAPNGNIAENIVVFEAPNNVEGNLSRPLEKVRDWEKRTVEKFDFTKKGGRKKKEVSIESNTDTSTKVDTKEEVKPEVSTEVELDEAVALTIDLNENKLTKNEVDIKKLKEWASSTKEPVDIVKQVIKNMANYDEPIKAMKTFINRGIKMIKEAKAEEERKANYVPSIPMFNWLEEQE
jgi:hypothetical protein